MIKSVAKISESNAELIRVTEYKDGTLFNPIQDADNNWIISLQEAQYINRSEIYFSIINFNPKIEENEFTTEN